MMGEEEENKNKNNETEYKAKNPSIIIEIWWFFGENEYKRTNRSNLPLSQKFDWARNKF